MAGSKRTGRPLAERSRNFARRSAVECPQAAEASRRPSFFLCPPNQALMRFSIADHLREDTHNQTSPCEAQSGLNAATRSLENASSQVLLQPFKGGADHDRPQHSDFLILIFTACGEHARSYRSIAARTRLLLVGPA